MLDLLEGERSSMLTLDVGTFLHGGGMIRFLVQGREVRDRLILVCTECLGSEEGNRFPWGWRERFVSWNDRKEFEWGERKEYPILFREIGW